MSKGLKTAGMLLAVILTSFTFASAQYYEPAVFVNLDEVEGLTPNGHIPDGGTITIPVRFKNVDEARTHVSNGYKFTDPYYNQIAWDDLTGQWNPAYPWTVYFDYGVYINEFDDVIGFAGLTAYGTGLPADFDGIAYYITLTNVTGPAGSLLTMDSSWWQPANLWLWSGVYEYVYWGGPYEMMIEYVPVCTYASPQPTILKDMEQLIEFYICCHDPDEIVWESILIQGKIPPYEGYPVLRDGCVVTACLTTRFIGSSGYRPIPPEGVQDQYRIDFDRTTGEHVTLFGDYVLTVYQGDVNLDGVVDISDVQFMHEYFFNSGKACFYEEFMDVDGNGRVDLRDVSALIELVNI
ncbi:MAG: hypothetical protein JSU74_03025 [Candidatus Zixiibacteriota bacterium]|nr:MAG: hypothetical protein JSU74_03025 [candidate division Zixibacteria bacterium]